MKILIVGSGGREHALAWKAAQSPLVERVYCAPGNAGTKRENKCENIEWTRISDLVRFALDKKVGLTVVGPETLLTEGIVDEFQGLGLPIFGPPRRAAALEGSKSFAKDFMKKYGISTAESDMFSDPGRAMDHLDHCSYPAVIKADGLACGKGVLICRDQAQAKQAVTEIMIERRFGSAGEKIVIEEFLEGVEASILSITDGQTILPFLPSRDYKRALDNDEGLNTGGMGVVAPNPACTSEVMELFRQEILEPTLIGLRAEGMGFAGTLFFGLMITDKGVRLLEYNVRMGDPETQAVLPLMESDYIALMLEAVGGRLSCAKIRWIDRQACCITAVSKGYPGPFKTGCPISGLDQVSCQVFLAGAREEQGQTLTSGGRVLNVTAVEDTIGQARETAYRELEKLYFDGICYRNDIGRF